MAHWGLTCTSLPLNCQGSPNYSWIRNDTQGVAQTVLYTSGFRTILWQLINWFEYSKINYFIATELLIIAFINIKTSIISEIENTIIEHLVMPQAIIPSVYEPYWRSVLMTLMFSTELVTQGLNRYEQRTNMISSANIYSPIQIFIKVFILLYRCIVLDRKAVGTAG